MFGQADKSKNKIAHTETHKFLYLPVTNPITGRTWLNNNLGADYANTKKPDNFKPAQQAKASNDYHAYGSLFQWGRKADGHELIEWSGGKTGVGGAITTKKSDTPDDAAFIISKIWSGEDWRKNPNSSLWATEASPNNVCPVGYRLPTTTEWKKEVNSWGTESKTSVQALASTLRLPNSGRRHIHGKINTYSAGSNGDYWSTENYNSIGHDLRFSGSASPGPIYVSYNDFGLAVRCIKD
jgi:uncharacterized protein (TIGR02145 family)